jgi:hypothetical protein
MNRSSLAINTRYGCDFDEVESGDPQGKIVLLLHGHSENCLFLFPEDGLPAAVGIRLITRQSRTQNDALLAGIGTANRFHQQSHRRARHKFHTPNAVDLDCTGCRMNAASLKAGFNELIISQGFGVNAPFSLFLGTVHARPVADSRPFPVGGVAGIYHVAILP